MKQKQKSPRGKEKVEMNDFQSVKNLIIQLVKEKTGGFDDDSWEADYKLNWEAEMSERLEKALFNMSKMASARESGDDVMLTAALVHSRMNFMDLANFFRDIYDDLDALLVKPVWPDIPEGFDYGKSSN
ncbi:hypothetical protein [Pseudomonas sp. Seg1]|uniref:hypothetical protein n=2 Tax=unclassified Pseudomonas TaxID=196821 RepID=UPI001BB3A768|nr:hypothetical protein [Pseudomonas sp. Seg1]